MDQPKYTYRDFATGKTRYTRGQFAGWTQPTGPLNARYAIFCRKGDTLYVPAYCLSKESREQLPKPDAAA